MNKMIVFIAVIAALATIGIVYTASYQAPSAQPPVLEGTVIEITSAGFSPQNVTISAGDKVGFVNRDSAPHWPASAPHPAHTDYPGFDALKGLAQNEVFTFTFNQAGEWKYHDHLNCCTNPAFFGTVIVG